MTRFWMALGALVTLFALASLVIITADALNSGAKRDRYVACVVARAVAQLPDPHGGPCHSPTAAERAASGRAAAAFVVEVECRVRGAVEGQPATIPGQSCVATAAPATTTTTTAPLSQSTTTTAARPGQAASPRVRGAVSSVAASPSNPFTPAPVLVVTVTPPPIIVTVPNLPSLP